MEQTATHDELVQFAAEKLGIEIKSPARWGVAWDGPSTGCYMFRDSSGLLKKFDLTSWDLMGKGLAAFKNDRQEFSLEFDGCYVPRSDGNFGLGCIILENWDWERSKKLFFQTIPDIPLTFWTAWYELEHSSHTKESTNS